ncbi:MAG: acylphosphatase [Fimbriimonadales bacterium]|nr:acylphosphatase [Fimbriimonadales bacterium]
MPTRSFTVTGVVQGVGFRWFTQRLGRRLGVRGSVWNSPDGTVRGLASHDDAAVLERFLSELTGGPGRVDRVLSAETFENVSWPDFRIESG